MNYPFPDSFRQAVAAVESDWKLPWPYLILPEAPNDQLLEDLERNGFDRDLVIGWLADLKRKKDQDLLELAVQDEEMGFEESPALIVLQNRSSQALLDCVVALTSSTRVADRVTAVSVLMRELGKQFPQDAQSIVIGMLSCESDVRVLKVIVYALYHLGVENRSYLVSQFACSSDSKVREAVAYCLGGLDDKLAIQLLISMMQDPVVEVRSWATYGLASISDANSSLICDSLYDRSFDSVPEIRHEAISGLVARSDQRALDRLIKQFEEGPVGSICLEAAIELAEPRLHSYLLKLKDEISGSRSVKLLEKALQVCQPSS